MDAENNETGREPSALEALLISPVVVDAEDLPLVLVRLR
jgi:hypothetical protein